MRSADPELGVGSGSGSALQDVRRLREPPAVWEASAKLPARGPGGFAAGTFVGRPWLPAAWRVHPTASRPSTPDRAHRGSRRAPYTESRRPRARETPESEHGTQAPGFERGEGLRAPRSRKVSASERFRPWRSRGVPRSWIRAGVLEGSGSERGLWGGHVPGSEPGLPEGGRRARLSRGPCSRGAPSCSSGPRGSVQRPRHAPSEPRPSRPGPEREPHSSAEAGGLGPLEAPASLRGGLGVVGPPAGSLPPPPRARSKPHSPP